MEISHDNWIQEIGDWLRQSESAHPTEAVVTWIAEASPQALEELLQVVEANLELFAESTQRLTILMQASASRLLASFKEDPAGEIATVSPELLSQLFDRLSPLEGQAAAHALQVLAAQGDEESIEALAMSLDETPPADWQHAGLALSPLWDASPTQLELFFERLQEGLFHPTVMAILLDLANYSVRNQKLELHPWSDRVKELANLLSQVIVRLEQLQRDPTKFGDQVEQIQQVLGESVALTVALCDALGLIGGSVAIESLLQAQELAHRRIQAEAAAALARLGDQRGKDHLIELAADPVARLRAVTYAEEIGLGEQIAEDQKTPLALAESELASWLANPEQFGFPPSKIELLDTRTQFWPSYEDPQNCFLFHYEYNLPGGKVANTGMAGPLTHAFHADLTHLSVDDAYAAFAGWQAEHEEIFEVPIKLLNSAQQRETRQLADHFEEQGFKVSEGLALTFLLGEIAFLARLEKGHQAFFGITDGLETLCFPVSEASTSMTPEIALAVYRGRKLLRTFNP